MKKQAIKFFGTKSTALFDYWSIGHIAFYFVLTKVYLFQFSIERALLIAIVIAYAWEFLERSLESWDYNHKKHFFKEKECWQNRYIGDVISGLIGFFIGYF